MAYIVIIDYWGDDYSRTTVKSITETDIFGGRKVLLSPTDSLHGVQHDIVEEINRLNGRFDSYPGDWVPLLFHFSLFSLWTRKSVKAEQGVRVPPFPYR